MEEEMKVAFEGISTRDCFLEMGVSENRCRFFCKFALWEISATNTGKKSFFHSSYILFEGSLLTMNKIDHQRDV